MKPLRKVDIILAAVTLVIDIAFLCLSVKQSLLITQTGSEEFGFLVS
jgi:hypothetical protein